MNESTGALLDQLRPYLMQMVQAMFGEFERKFPITTYGPATVVTADPRSGVCQVIPDESPTREVIAAHTLAGDPAASARVMLQYTPPSGVYVIGYLSPLRTPQAIGFRARTVVGTTTVSGVGSTINWDVVKNDGFGFVAGSTVTIPAGLAGRYIASVSIQFSAAPTPPQLEFVDILPPGGPSGVLWPTRGYAQQGSSICSACTVFSVGDGDVVQFNAWQSTGSNQTIAGDVEMWRLGD